MTDEFSGQNIVKLSVLLLIVFHEFQLAQFTTLQQHYNITTADPAALVANRKGNHVTVTSMAYALSPVITVTRAASSANGGTDGAVNLVEAPVEVSRPRVVDSEITAKVDRKRESAGSQIEIGVMTAPRDLQCCKDNGARKLKNDDKLKEDSFKVYDEVRASAIRGGRAEISDDDEDDKNDEDESRGPKMVHDEDDDDEDDDEEDGDDDKVRWNLRRKEPRCSYDKSRPSAVIGKRHACIMLLLALAGRPYKEGPKIWDQWGKWTSCSVTCGAGKLTRWRHCVAGGCSVGEKEAQLKTCTFSAC